MPKKFQLQPRLHCIAGIFTYIRTEVDGFNYNRGCTALQALRMDWFRAKRCFNYNRGCTALQVTIASITVKDCFNYNRGCTALQESRKRDQEAG